MKQFLEDDKWMVLSDKSKKSVIFKFRVDVWRRADNLPEDRTKRKGLGANPVRRILFTIDRILTVRERTHGFDEITSHTEVGQATHGHVPAGRSRILDRQCSLTCVVQSLMTVP